MLIVDWDIHHGQGVQYCFEDDPRYVFTYERVSLDGSLQEILIYARYPPPTPPPPQCALLLMAPL